MRYLNAPNTAFGEDRRTYKVGTNGVTSNQTVFNVSYDNGRVEAYLNGVRLYPGDDFSKLSSGIGATITLASAIGASNVLEIVGYQGINSGNALVEDNFVVGTGSTGSGGSYTNSTTEFPVASSAGDTVSVWRNGVKLVPTTDYTVQVSTSKVTLLSAASSADEITVQVVGGVIHNNGLTVNSGSNSFFLPTTRGTDRQVLSRTGSSGATTWSDTITSPAITSITYPTQNGVQATALAGTGAQDTTAETLLINGNYFTSTVTVNISGNGVSSSAFAGTVSVNTAGTVITCSNVTKQASADNYTLTVANSTGLTATTTVNFSADPSFTTASGSLGQVFTTLATTKTITAGSSVSWYEGTPTMPTWMTHFADADTGTSKDLTGTPTNSSTTEVQNFNIIIRDSENQSHNRDFSLTVSDLPISTNAGNKGIITTYTGYRVHSWTATGTDTDGFTLYADTVCDVLMVGGGGGGGGSGASGTQGGGGGGGGVYEMTQVTLPAGDYSITVGTGGNGGYGYGTNIAVNGVASSITFPNSTTYSATGGGHGGMWGVGYQASNTGASGGGGGGQANTSYNQGESGTYKSDSGLPTGHLTYGNDGGDGNTNVSAGGGGGGAGSDGYDSPSTGTGGNGGTGRSNSWRANTAVIYGAGGGGGANANAGYGGNNATDDGAGNGSTDGSDGGNGLANQGGGGGGSATGSSGNHNGGTGGSGIVIIRYAI